MERKILVICGHPNLKASRVNSAILKEVSEHAVTVHNLSEHHENFNFDVEKVNNIFRKLEATDSFVFRHEFVDFILMKFTFQIV